MKQVTSQDAFFRALEFYTPYVVARPPVAQKLALGAFGAPPDPAHAIHPVHVIDPLALDQQPFIDTIYHLHRQVCGPFGMAMEKWVGYDCGFMPGVVFGFGRPRALVSAEICNGLGVPDGYDELVPYSVGIAIPLPDRSTWLVHALGSLNQVAPGAGPTGLKRLSLVFGSNVLRAKALLTVVRWRSPLMSAFASLGPIEVVTAWTPAHDYPSSVTGRVVISDAAYALAMQARVPNHARVDYTIDADDHTAMQALQQDIEEGVAVQIVGPGDDLGTAVRYPLATDRVPRHFVRVQEQM